MELAIAGDDHANAVLNGEATYALHHAQSKRAAADDGSAWHPRPRGSAPSDYPEWDSGRGVWVNATGDARPEARPSAMVMVTPPFQRQRCRQRKLCSTFYSLQRIAISSCSQRSKEAQSKAAFMGTSRL
jgi:hypothetical protein